LEYAASEKLSKAIGKHESYIESETIATSLRATAKPDGEAKAEHTFDGEELIIALSKD
jgi:hypothetical protein